MAAQDRRADARREAINYDLDRGRLRSQASPSSVPLLPSSNPIGVAGNPAKIPKIPIAGLPTEVINLGAKQSIGKNSTTPGLKEGQSGEKYFLNLETVLREIFQPTVAVKERRHPSKYLTLCAYEHDASQAAHEELLYFGGNGEYLDPFMRKEVGPRGVKILILITDRGCTTTHKTNLVDYVHKGPRPDG